MISNFIYFDCEQIGDFEEENTIDSSLHNANIRPNPKIQSRLIEIENSSVLGDKREMRHTSGLQIRHHTRHGGGKENVQVCIPISPLCSFNLFMFILPTIFFS